GEHSEADRGDHNADCVGCAGHSLSQASDSLGPSNTALSCARRLMKVRAREAREGAPLACEPPSPRVSFNALFDGVVSMLAQSLRLVSPWALCAPSSQTPISATSFAFSESTVGSREWVRYAAGISFHVVDTSSGFSSSAVKRARKSAARAAACSGEYL